ncbi:HD domain-containing protein [Defluviimonas sp. D31]|uniref:HD domain-containing protein n=1 Tax=Defluviimonas sp. D31 TaxID=3083253 RepID=UPI00296FBA98|nr:HD domain-containing protein [Defluviimonas sp. D31]MDW4549000.1 HD domain-containing protein [Defluviimonas sp. D31]
MTFAPLREALRTALAECGGDRDAAHDLAHADRVWANARAIATGEGMAPTRVLLCAAYLHDLVTLPKDHPDRARAAALSAEASGPILTALGLAPEEIAASAHAIAAHSYSGGVAPRTPEAAILRDADRLEALGAIGIARCFAVSAALGRPLFDGADPFAATRPVDDRAFALDHFAVKLLKLPETFLTTTGRRMAEARAATMHRYLAELATELGQPAPDW